MSEPTGKHYRIETISDIVDSDIPDDRLGVIIEDFCKVVAMARSLKNAGLRDAWTGHFVFIDDDEGTVDLTPVDPLEISE